MRYEYDRDYGILRFPHWQMMRLGKHLRLMPGKLVPVWTPATPGVWRAFVFGTAYTYLVRCNANGEALLLAVIEGANGVVEPRPDAVPREYLERALRELTPVCMKRMDRTQPA